MRLQKFSVRGLFGLFDHDISLHLDERITILHAPNGYGKTAILKIISNFFGGSLAVFRQFEFKRVILEFDNQSTVTISQREADADRLANPRLRPRFYTITLKAPGDSKAREYDPWTRTERQDQSRSDIPSVVVERYVPFLSRAGGGEFIDRRTGTGIPYYEAIEKFWDYLPDALKARRPLPKWLEETRNSVHCRLIETQRLMNISDRDRQGKDDLPIIPAVKTNSAELASLIGRTLAESATLSQSLDRTFPNRLLRESGPPYSEAQLRRRLASLEQRRSRLAAVGLLDRSDDSSIIPAKTFGIATRRILTEYVTDAEKKLDVYNDLLSRIELLTDIINSRFQFKTLLIDRNEGMLLRDIAGRPVDLETLSSGEQHELVLLYDLLFKTKKDTLLLVDEPEISLHIAWQKKFLSDLRRIIALSPMDIVLSTHSPQLIGSYLDLAVQLQGPRDAKSH